MFFGNDVWVPWNMSRPISRKGARVNVVAAAGAAADQHGDRMRFVEVLDRLGVGGLLAKQCDDSKIKRHGATPWAYSVTSGRSSTLANLRRRRRRDFTSSLQPVLLLHRREKSFALQGIEQAGIDIIADLLADIGELFEDILRARQPKVRGSAAIAA